VAVATVVLGLSTAHGLGAAAARTQDATSTEPDSVLLAAGDIATCPGTGDEATAAILDGYPTATVAALGDLVYDAGTPEEFRDCYEPSWGQHKARTKPATGNHEYDTPGATGYFGYWGAAAGTAGKGWYSYDLGSWHVVVLNSNCEEVTVDCAPTSEQVEWLEADLAASEAACTLAYWHHPLFTSGYHAGEANLQLVRPFWDALYEHGADLILVGHDHSYERFAPQTPSGFADSVYGIRQFVVGTGGAPLRGFMTVAANSQVRDYSTVGVLRLTLRSGGYDWSFLAPTGATFTDTGSGGCHGAPPNPTSSSHTSAWSNDRTVDVTWSGASDSGSGVDGFSYSWTQSADGGEPDYLKDAEETATGTTSPELADGSWWFHLRTRDNAGNWSEATHLGPFSIDTTAPWNPTLSSPSHTPNVWSNDPTVEAAWTGASDGHSGVDGYAYSWTQQAASDPGMTKSAEESASATTSPSLADGNWWLHLRTRDNAGNWSAAVHLGPFRIDTIAPANPTLSSSSHAVDAWSNDSTVDVSWSGAVDSGSGVDGYSYAWSQSGTTVPDQTKDTSATNSALAEGSWWFHLRAVDAAGNWNGSAVHLGPFRIDTTAPTNPTLSSTHPANWSTDRTVDVAWTGATDGASGIDGYSIGWFQSAVTPLDMTKDTALSSATSAPLADGSWWFHLRTVDAAGNWSAAVNLGPLRIDGTAPTNPEVSSTSHDVGDWSNDDTIDVTWSGSSDAHSGVDGFSYTWSQIESTAPDQVKDPAISSTISDELSDGSWWFHLRTVDTAGNWSAAFHLGPFKIDTTLPTNPTLASPSHAVGTWSNENTVVVRWNGTPAPSYSYEWSQSESTIPDAVPEGPETEFTEDLLDGAWWFHVHAQGESGSWSGTSHLGPFLIDTTAPETYVASTGAGFEFSASEPAGFRCALDGAAYADCVSPVRYDNLPPGEHVFRVFARDRAGNADATPAEYRWTIVAAPPPPPPPPSPPQPQPPPPPKSDRGVRCVVPRLAGRTLKRARTLLARADCRLGLVRAVYSRRVRKGRVLTQAPRAGTRLARGARVSVSVSLGPRPRRR
jgi:hypothetical protein